MKRLIHSILTPFIFKQPILSSGKYEIRLKTPDGESNPSGIYCNSYFHALVEKAWYNTDPRSDAYGLRASISRC
jgi:hypothetical protein